MKHLGNNHEVFSQKCYACVGLFCTTNKIYLFSIIENWILNFLFPQVVVTAWVAEADHLELVQAVCHLTPSLSKLRR